MESPCLGLTDGNGLIKDAVSFLAPIIDPPKFGTWLFEEVQAAPCLFVSFSCSFFEIKRVILC